MAILHSEISGIRKIAGNHIDCVCIFNTPSGPNQSNYYLNNLLARRQSCHWLSPYFFQVLPRNQESQLLTIMCMKHLENMARSIVWFQKCYCDLLPEHIHMCPWSGNASHQMWCSEGQFLPYISCSLYLKKLTWMIIRWTTTPEKYVSMISLYLSWGMNYTNRIGEQNVIELALDICVLKLVKIM